ncbi:DUF3443 family protein [Paraburkholderia caribensis]|uniref:DUF3443 family protein n=1 Tax=Paraburkholderia caribensis TaxID=75105 RepID=A0A9Q6WK66_9BURK|nr:DUF3443 domain-containing protein [Paraburkholderia caribensis]MCO4880075.1 DUF3443 family protein [Paraburkholderia caribensis]PTB27636.1 hypothetical protein C9I56_16490 [Paraburkholderia caribensis]QLB61518.1 hypothetical protein A9O66_03435 [Paraburkholderia caribensis]
MNTVLIDAARFAQGTIVALATLVIVAGCGGGDSSTTNTAGNSPQSTPASPGATASSPASGSVPAPASAPVATVPQSTIPNVHPIVVTSTPTQTRNMLTTSVTVCVPGTSNCVTIDNVQVDTGSQGLRVLASQLPASLVLPAVPATPPAGTANTVNGECSVFGTGFTWGAVRTADVRMASQLAPGIPIQVIADPSVPTVPSDCAASGLPMMTPSALRVNGILGVGLFSADCGGGCISSALPRWYYACDSTGSCTSTRQPLAQQVANPISQFALDNNGIVLDLPAVGPNGAATLNGSMIFGIGTQANNTLGDATVLKANTTSGYVTTSLNGQPYSQSFFDSGSNGLFFPSTTLARCGFWWCPASTQSMTATVTGTNGASASPAFSIANAQALFATQNNAFNNLGGPSNAFDWGLPFFFGRRVYTAIESRLTSAGKGPFYAF